MTTRRGKSPSGRSVANEVLTRVEATDAYADILLSKKLKGLDARECAFATELVYGVLRWQIKIDWIIDLFSKVKTGKLEHALLVPLRLGVYQLLFLTKIPVQAAIDESVELAKHSGKAGGQPVGKADQKRAGYVNAVLRSIERGKDTITFPILKREPVKYVSVVFSHPEWLVERWIGAYGMKDALELCQANLRVPPLTLRVNTLKTTREKLREELSGIGVNAEPCIYSPYGLTVTGKPRGGIDPEDERYYIQDEASQLVALLLDPKPGEAVLDVCAAPGGKTTHLAELMHSEGAIYAIDKFRARLKTVEKLARRLGVGIITTKVADASVIEIQPELFPGDAAGADLVLASALSSGFDRVLVDAPCSGLGVLRRTPDIKLKRSEADIFEVSRLQKRILSNASRYVRKGGRLVYSVCTMEAEETRHQLEWFLSKAQGFKVVDASEVLPKECAPLINADGTLSTSPGRDDLDGFFAVCFERVD